MSLLDKRSIFCYRKLDTGDHHSVLFSVKTLICKLCYFVERKYVYAINELKDFYMVAFEYSDDTILWVFEFINGLFPCSTK